MHVCPPPLIQHMMGPIWRLICLQTLSPAAVAAIVSPLNKEKRFAFILQFYTLFRCLCVLGKQPILFGRLKKAAVSIRLWQHFMLQNDKWRGGDPAGPQLKHTLIHTETHTLASFWGLHTHNILHSPLLCQLTSTVNANLTPTLKTSLNL